MKVHWVQKWIQIQYGPNTVVLQGELPIPSECTLVQVYQMTDSEPEPVIPVEVQQLLTQYSHLFQPRTELPPRRPCDHSIPLLPGAQPVASRPYHYSPILKSEIESQINKMLQSGLIRPSTSAFSSPVLWPFSLLLTNDDHICNTASLLYSQIRGASNAMANEAVY
jgi:hypothetical protein